MMVIVRSRPWEMICDQPFGWFRGDKQTTIWLALFRVTILH